MAVYCIGNSHPIVLIDEIENGMHFSILKEVARFFVEHAKKNNQQFFFSTHSREMIEAFAQVESQSTEELLSFHRVHYHGTNRQITRFSNSEVQSLLSIDAEIR